MVSTSRARPPKVRIAPASNRLMPVYPLTVLASNWNPWAGLGFGVPGTRAPKVMAWVSLLRPPPYWAGANAGICTTRSRGSEVR